MPRYLVTWEIDEFEDTPELAARAAWRHMRNPDSTANVFTVIDENGEQTKVDLQEIDEDREVEGLAIIGGGMIFDGEDRSGECA